MQRINSIFTGMKTIFLFIVSLFFYALLDLAFINLFAREFIQRQVGWLLAPRPDLLAAVLFYLIFVASLLYFCVWPAQNPGKAILNGAIFGLVTYATYELVNKSLLDRWPWQLVAVDIAWGIFVGALVSALSFKAAGYLGIVPNAPTTNAGR